jgi:hypothetical protein
MLLFAAAAILILGFSSRGFKQLFAKKLFRRCSHRMSNLAKIFQSPPFTQTLPRIQRLEFL